MPSPQLREFDMIPLTAISCRVFAELFPRRLACNLSTQKAYFSTAFFSSL
jgi:hypothetical protein